MIPFLDLQAQYKSIRSEVTDAVEKTLESCQFALGPEVEAFEHEFAAFCGSRYGVGVNSGTSALHLALLASGVGAGDEVVTVSATFVATVAAIDYVGARPVFVDIKQDTLTMDPKCIEAVITERTKAIIPVHLHGQPADMDAIVEIAARYGLAVIEDAAQAHGAQYGGRRVGSIGNLGCFSFYPGKNLGAYGEAGIVVTDDAEYAEQMRVLRDWGQERKYHHVRKGFNYRMDGLQGAVLRVKLRHLEQWTEMRRQHAATYGQILQDSCVRIPTPVKAGRHVYHVYGVRSEARDSLQRFLLEAGIQTAIHYPIPVHLQKAYADPDQAPPDLPITERASRELLSLPMYPELSRAQIEEVGAAVLEFLPEELTGA